MIETVGIAVAIVTGVVAMITGIIALIFSLAQARTQKKKDRLYFLANIIVDKSIARKSRQIFYDEFIALGGNGSFVKFWLEEESQA